MKAKIDMSAVPVRKVLEADVTHDQKFSIEVSYAGVRDKWSVVCPETTFEMEAASLCEALHKLANEYEANDLFGSGKFDPNATETRRRTRQCTSCQGRFFFAETRNGKWMPVDAESVPASMLGSTAGHALIPVNGGTRAPQAHRVTPQFHGQVWIAHPNVCGSRPDAPDSEFLKVRWEKNRGVTIQATEDAAQHLQQLAHELLTPTVTKAA